MYYMIQTCPQDFTSDGADSQEIKIQGEKSNNELEFRTIEKSILTKTGGQGVFPGEMTCQLSLKASVGISQVKSNEILSEEIMFKLPSRILVIESTTSFPFGDFLLPEAIIAVNFPAEKKINRGCFATWLDFQKTGNQAYR